GSAIALTGTRASHLKSLDIAFKPKLAPIHRVNHSDTNKSCASRRSWLALRLLLFLRHFLTGLLRLLSYFFGSPDNILGDGSFLRFLGFGALCTLRCLFRSSFGRCMVGYFSGTFFRFLGGNVFRPLSG